MTSNFNTVLIIGGTSGIGEAFARRFHSLGKKVIVTGRRLDRLDTLAKELKGIETYQWDIANLDSLPGHVTSILKKFPRLDTVFVNADIQECFSLLDTSTASAADIVTEVSTNLTAPTLLTRLFAPHLLSLASGGTKSTLLVTSSALAFVPLSFYPVYSSTKSALHSLCVVLRQQLSFQPDETAKENLSIVEAVPPYTDTDLDKEHRQATIAMQDGPDKAFNPMPLNEYIDQAFASLDELGPDGKLKKEIGVGFGQVGADTWRESFGKIYEGMGLAS